MRATALSDVLSPNIGGAAPVSVVRVGAGVVMAVLCAVTIANPALAVVGLALAALALVFPRVPSAWVLILVIAAPLLVGDATLSVWHVVILIAGVHALHQLGLIGFWLPRRGRVELRVLGRVLVRYLVVQLPVQAVAIALLLALDGSSLQGLSSPWFGIAAAVGLIALVAVVVVPILSGRRDTGER